LNDLAAKTGLSREEILSRLSRDLAKALDDMTPAGQTPADGDDDTNPAGLTSVPPLKPQIV
jgi:uncharacterized protein YidB (DUF937 family)